MISCLLNPFASKLRTIETVMRIPLIQALPVITFGSEVILSIASMIVILIIISNILNLEEKVSIVELLEIYAII